MRIRHLSRSSFLALAAVVAVAACDNAPTRPDMGAPSFSTSASGSASTGDLQARMQKANVQLADRGSDYRIGMAEYVTSAWSGEVGQVVFANDRELRLPEQFVAGDPRRGGRTNITYLVDGSDGATTIPLMGAASGLTAAQTSGAIDRAMTTWQDQPDCASLSIDRVADPGIDPDITDAYVLNDPALYGTAGLADIVDAGWEPAAFFDALAPGGSNFILGVTFTWYFVDESGNPTDIDGDGHVDAAFREIYYNDAFTWGIDIPTTASDVDVESVVLHESGHGLSEGHFGKIFGTIGNPYKLTPGSFLLHFSPFAVMNAAISRTEHTLQPTDLASFCSIYGSWPSS